MAEEQAPGRGESPNRWVSRQIFVDPTPNAVVQSRISLKAAEVLQVGNWSEDERHAAFNFSRLIALKLVAVWHHVDRYRRRQDELREEALRQPNDKDGTGTVRFVTAQDLYIELDEFLVQVKSTLDYVAKAPVLVLGERGWMVGSFGEHGKKLVRTLKQNTPGSFRKSATVLVLIIEENAPWLESLIGARDKVNHYLGGGLDPDLFTVSGIKDGEKIDIHVPMWSTEQSVLDMMDNGFEAVFHFVERFLCSVLASRLPAHLGMLTGPNIPLYDRASPITILPTSAFNAWAEKTGGGWRDVPTITR